MKSIILFLLIIFSVLSLDINAQCEADTNIFLTNFEFTPSQITIPIGYSVAFINLEGNHTVNGISNTITGESFNNPIEYFLNDTTGNEQGVCMGVIEFETPGVYNFDCSLNFNAEFGMNLNIVVDAFDLNDLFIEMQENQEPIFESYYAFQSFTPEYLTNSGPWTLFVPNSDAVNEILEYMNLNQFDALNIPDFPEIMEFHIAPGIWTTEDLTNGLQLISAQGQAIDVTQNNNGIFVNDAKIINSNNLAYNGVIHIIDKCLAPQGLPGAHVMQVITESPDHQILEEAIINLGYDDELSFQVLIDDSYDSPGPWTVFAPTDSAFGIFAQELGLNNEELLESQFLSNIIFNHIVQNQTTSAEMYSGNFVTNLEGNMLQFDYSDSSFYVIGNENTVEVTVTDVYAYNGVVHIIDAVIKPFIPVTEGSCGIWRLELQTTDAEEGWGEHYLSLEVNEILIDNITVFEGSSSQSYEFGVDYGDEINIYFVPINYVYGNISYKLYNQENQLIVQETESGNSQIGSTVGLIACQSVGKEYCGEITIKSYSYYEYGWLTASLEVYRNNQLDLEIPMPFGALQTTYLEANYNDVFNFEYNSGGFLIEDIGYEVYDVSGQLVINENIDNETPQSYSDLLICEAIMGTYNCNNNGCVDPMNGSGVYNSLEECQKQCNTSSIKENNPIINISPNPSSGIFYLKWFNENNNYQIKITDVLGNEIFEKQIKNKGEQSRKIDLSGHSKGVYNLSIISENHTSTSKVLLH